MTESCAQCGNNIGPFQTKDTLAVDVFVAQVDLEGSVCVGCFRLPSPARTARRKSLRQQIAAQVTSSTGAFGGAVFAFTREYLGLRRTQVAGLGEVDEAQVEVWENEGGVTELLADALRMMLREKLDGLLLPRGSSSQCIYVRSDGTKPNYCRGTLDESSEHILLAGLGGRLEDSEVDCSGCNNTLGSTAHKELASAFHPFLVLAGALTGRDAEHRPLEATTNDGREIRLASGGFPELPAEITREKQSDGTVSIAIRESSAQGFRHRLEQVRGRAMSDEEFAQLEVEYTVERPEVGVHLALGGPGQFAGVASMALHLLAWRLGTDALTGAELDAVKTWIAAPTTPTEYVRWATGHDLQLPPPVNALIGRGVSCVIAVTACPTTAFVIGRVLLAGEFQFEVVLTQGWRGPVVGVAYGVDPVTCREYGPVDFSPWTVPVTRPDELMDLTAQKAAATRTVASVYKIQEAAANHSLASEVAAQAVEEVFGKLPIGTTILPEHTAELAGRVAELFVTRTMGGSTSKKMRLGDVERGMKAADSVTGRNRAERRKAKRSRKRGR